VIWQTKQEIISPINVVKDRCNRLWVLDCGVQNISGMSNWIENPKPRLIAYNLQTNKTVVDFSFPSDVLDFESFLTNFVVDIEKSCDTEVFVYISDFNGRSLIQYDVQNEQAIRLKHNFFNPDPEVILPEEVIFNKNQKTVSGIHGLAFTDNQLVVSPFASKNEFGINRTILHHISQYLLPTGTIENDKITHLLTRSSPASTLRFDPNTKNMFYAGLKKIGCKNINNDFIEIDIGIEDGYLSDIQIDGPYLYYLVNNNNSFTIANRELTSLVKGTVCENVPTLVTRLGLDDVEKEDSKNYKNSGSKIVLSFVGFVINYLFLMRF